MLALAEALGREGKLFAAHRTSYWAIAGGVAAALAAILWVPPLAAVFDVAPPSASLAAIAVTTAFASGGWSLLARRFGTDGFRP